jgi:branched-subunit amino acid aminotransferase/4-amino-4-deoxychorismate lyase
LAFLPAGLAGLRREKRERMKKRPHLPILTSHELFRGKIPPDDPRSGRYFAMYSSVLGGIVTDPRLMTVPLDDHMVHRGDGVFETLAIHHGKLYQLAAHLRRLVRSAEIAGIEFPAPEHEIEEILLETAAVAQAREGAARIFISRGTGGFSVNPKECSQSHLYMIVTAPEPPPAAHYIHGVRVITSSIPARRAEMAQLKSCNYMPNALMELEASRKGVDSAVGIDEGGFLAEGSNKNVGLVTAQREFQTPAFHHSLQGTTLIRVMELARRLVEEGVLADVVQRDIPREEAYRALEMMFLGTTLKVLPIVQFDGHPIGTGQPGPVVRRLRAELERDMRENHSLLTPIPYAN